MCKCRFIVLTKLFKLWLFRGNIAGGFMNSSTSTEASCNVTLLIDHFYEPSIEYNVSSGTARKFTLIGVVKDLDYGPLGLGPATPGSRFHNCGVRVEVKTPVDLDTLNRLQINLLEGSNDLARGLLAPQVICGAFTTDKDLRGKVFSADGLNIELEPIEVFLWLPRDAFEDLLSQVTASQRNTRILSIRLCLVGKELSSVEASTDSVFGLSLSDLDIIEKHVYAVQGFESSETTITISKRQSFSKAHWDKDAPITSLRVQLSEIRTQYHLALEQPLEVVCTGEVIGAYGKPYQGAIVECFFSELETRLMHNRTEPTKFGEFWFRPADPQDKESQPSLSLSLRYDPEDPSDMVHRLLSLGYGSQVDLMLILDGNCESLDGEERVSGGVWRYELHISQVLATTKANPVLSCEAMIRLDASVQKLTDTADESRRLHADLPVGQQVATKDDIDHAIRCMESAQDKDGLRLLTRYVQMIHDRLNSSVIYSIGALVAGVAAVVAVFWRT